MTNEHDSNKTPPPPPPPPPPPTGTKPGEVKPDSSVQQLPQLRLAVVSGIGGFVGALVGALLACHFCMLHHS